MIHPHKEIEVGDLVEHDGNEYIVKYIWNHGLYQWWFDLEATTTAIEGLDLYFNQLSVPSEKCKLIKKKNS